MSSGLICPHCGSQFYALVSNDCEVPALAPLVCSTCVEVSLIVAGQAIRKATVEEMEELKAKPIWLKMIVPIQKSLRRQQLAANARNN